MSDEPVEPETRGVTVEPLATVEDAVARAMAVTPPEGQVVVAGSLYLVGTARSALK